MGRSDSHSDQFETVTLHVGGLGFASEKAVVERAVGRRPGVIEVEANPVAQTTSVTYSSHATTVEALSEWVEQCGFQCAGTPRISKRRINIATVLWPTTTPRPCRSSAVMRGTP